MPATQKPRVACYCRISSDPKDKREGVDRQREDTATLCELKGWKIADVYVDNDRSASNGKGRPEWDRLLADIAAGKIDAVAAWDQDRVNRMMEDFVAYKKLFVDRGILLATSNNGDIDLSTPTGVLTATIKTAVSEHEVAMMRIRMKRAARQRAERGIPKWKRAFGYDGDTYQPDPVTAPLVKQAYAAILAGGSITDIARTWNTAGTHGLTGKPWSASTRQLVPARTAQRRTARPQRRDHRHGHLAAPGGRIHLAGSAVRAQRPRTRTWAQDGAPAPADRGAGLRQVRPPPVGQPHQRQANHLLLQAMSRGVRPRRARRAARHGPGGRSAGPPRRRGPAQDRAARRGRGRAAARPEADTLRPGWTRSPTNAPTAYSRGAGQDRATDRITEQLAAIERREQDAERLRVFDGIPLGTTEVADAVSRLSPDRLRAVLDVLMTVTVMPVGKGGHMFNPERVQVNWR